jgi:hypothetical protein
MQPRLLLAQKRDIAQNLRMFRECLGELCKYSALSVRMKAVLPFILTLSAEYLHRKTEGGINELQASLLKFSGRVSLVLSGFQTNDSALLNSLRASRRENHT